MALLQEIFSLYTDNTTGTLVGVLVITVIVYFVFFGKRKQPVVLKNTKSREIKSVDISTTEKQTVIKSAKKEATIEPETKQVSNADKESEASVDVTVKKEPVLAAYDATTAICLLESRQFIKSHFKVASKGSTISDVIVGNAAAVAIATATTAASRAIRSEYAKVEGLEFGKDPNEFVKQEENDAVNKNEAMVTETEEPLVTKENVEPIVVETIKVEPVQVEEKEDVSELVIESTESAIKEKEEVVLEQVPKVEADVSPAIAEETKKEVVEPVLAAYNATDAMTTLKALQYISSLPKAPKPFLAAYNATDAIITLEAQQYISSLPKAPKPFLAAYNATDAITTLEAQQYISSLPKAPKPFLAAYNATDAIITLEAQQYISSLPKAPKPFLAAYNATDAITTLEAQQYISSLPKAPKPFLAAYNATDAIITLEAQQYISSLPKAPKPFLAAYNATDAITTLEAQKYISALPKASKAPTPFLAAYNASTAQKALEAQQYVASKFKSDHTYIEALKSTLDRLQSQEKTNLSRSSSDDSLVLSASNVSIPREQVPVTHTEYLSALKTATSVIQSVASQTLLSEKSYDEEEENNGLSLSPSDASSSTSSLHSRALAETTRDVKPSRDINTDSDKDQGKALHINTIDQNNKPAPHFDMSWDQIYTGGNNNKKSPTKVQQSPTSMQASPVTITNEPFMSTVQCTYYPNCTNKNCKFIHPGNDNNPRPIPKRAVTVDVEYKKPWTRPERIERQSQTHYPTWKSRCVHWPYCTNNHCKYSHPIKECRMGDQCTFMERCMFLHPADFMEPVRKGPSRNNNNSNNTHLKRSNTTFN